MAIEACQLEWNDVLPVGCANGSRSWLKSLSRLRCDGDGSRVAHAKGYGKSPVSCSVNVTDGVNPVPGPGQALAVKWMEAEAGSGDRQKKGIKISGLKRFGTGDGRHEIASEIAEIPEGSAGKDLESIIASPEKTSSKPEDADSDCGSLPSTPRCPAAESNNGSSSGLNNSSIEAAELALENERQSSARDSQSDLVSYGI